MAKKRLYIFASGAGSNAERIIRYFHQSPELEAVHVVTNNPRAGVLQRVERLRQEGFEAEATVLPREVLTDGSQMAAWLRERQVDGVILAGYLLRVPEGMISAYPRSILNLHPSLLPKHGGKGMYGHHVHQAVLDAGEQESGISIHLVSDEIDGGTVLFQARCPVLPGDTPDSLAERIHHLEHEHYPQVIAAYFAPKAV